MKSEYPACWDWPLIPRQTGWSDEDHIEAFQTGTDVDGFHGLLCAVCGLTRQSKFHSFDHDHVTGLSRGFLCTRCNLAEGRSDAVAFDRYRWAPPAVLLNIRLAHRYMWRPAPRSKDTRNIGPWDLAAAVDRTILDEVQGVYERRQSKPGIWLYPTWEQLDQLIAAGGQPEIRRALLDGWISAETERAEANRRGMADLMTSLESIFPTDSEVAA